MSETEQEATAIEAPPKGVLEFRAATQLGVSFPNRTIELVVMPYEEPALVAHGDRMVTEICSAGAFAGIERRANRVRVNRDHDLTRTVGRAVAFHPSRSEGLIAELRIAQTPLGDETLQLADEEILDASAGFLPMPGGEVWETRSRRRLNKLWLGHIAMTPDPAYMGANVLAVRASDSPAAPGEPTATPNLDVVRGWMLGDRYARFDS
jgi:HK97 family phage prohead protease